MASEHTRRDFLKISGLGAATWAAARSAHATAFSDGTLPASAAGEVTVRVTDATQKFAKAPSLAWAPASTSPGEGTITLDPAKKHQEILGFGAAFTDAACYMLNELPPTARQELLHQLFHPSEMGLSVCRTCIGSSDYSTKLYSYDDGEVDTSLARFSIEHDRAYILPVLREARKQNPGLFLFASPWSPPGWMKANGSMLGGSMRREHMPAYANYFLKFVQSYAAEGVPVQAVTIQNEVDTDQDGRMPACIWPQEYEADFVRNHLGPLFRRSGANTAIWLIDHNYNLWGRALGELETPGVRDFAKAIAWHGYLGEPEWIDRVHKVYPEIEMHWTEGGPEYTDPNYARDWAEWSKTFTGILRNCCRSITTWNLALDEQGRPNIGPFACGGLLTVHSQSKEIAHSGQFWALSHYSRSIPRGARRYDSQSTIADVFHVAFERPDGRRVLVLTNPGAARTCQVQVGDSAATVALNGDSITTLEW